MQKLKPAFARSVGRHVTSLSKASTSIPIRSPTFAGLEGTLTVFICNHCPYVKASIDRIVAEAKALRDIGIGTIAIMPNDTKTYREDSFDNMKTLLYLPICDR